MPAPSFQCKTPADCSPWCLIDSFWSELSAPNPWSQPGRHEWLDGRRAAGWLGGCCQTANWGKPWFLSTAGCFSMHACLCVCVWKNAKMVISHMDWYRFTNTREGVVKIWDNLAVVVLKLVTSEYARVTVKKDIHIPHEASKKGEG